MYQGLSVVAIVPALNEAQAIGGVVEDLLALRALDGSVVIDEVIVTDNGSTDQTGLAAQQAGARVVREPRRGYGSACLAALRSADDFDVVLFVDGDQSVVIFESLLLLETLTNGADMVVGARTLGRIEAGAMTWPQRIGNRLVADLIGWIWRTTVSDLGPFRAVRRTALQDMSMQDPDYGWIVEMQVKALQRRLKIVEVPVSCKVRIGHSKVSGTVRGVIGAAIGMFRALFYFGWQGRQIAGGSRPVPSLPAAPRLPFEHK